MPQDNLSIFVIGCGLRNVGDDAVGLQVVSELQRVPDLGFELRALEGDRPQGFLAEFPADALVIFVDSMRTDAAPGTIHCMRLPSKTARPRHLDSEETKSLQSELDHITKRGAAVPRMFLIGVEIAEESGPGLSEKVQKSVEEVVGNFQRYLKLARDLT